VRFALCFPALPSVILGDSFRTLAIGIHRRHDRNPKPGSNGTPTLPILAQPHRLIPARHPLGSANMLAVGFGKAKPEQSALPDQFPLELGLLQFSAIRGLD
jgi:hypothetical protein